MWIGTRCLHSAIVTCLEVEGGYADQAFVRQTGRGLGLYRSGKGLRSATYSWCFQLAMSSLLQVSAPGAVVAKFCGTAGVQIHFLLSRRKCTCTQTFTCTDANNLYICPELPRTNGINTPVQMLWLIIAKTWEWFAYILTWSPCAVWHLHINYIQYVLVRYLYMAILDIYTCDKHTVCSWCASDIRMDHVNDFNVLAVIGHCLYRVIFAICTWQFWTSVTVIYIYLAVLNICTS